MAEKPFKIEITHNPYIQWMQHVVKRGLCGREYEYHSGRDHMQEVCGPPMEPAAEPGSLPECSECLVRISEQLVLNRPSVGDAFNVRVRLNN